MNPAVVYLQLVNFKEITLDYVGGPHLISRRPEG